MEFNTFEAKSSLSDTHTHTKQTSACTFRWRDSGHEHTQHDAYKVVIREKNLSAHTFEQHAVQWSSPPWSSVITNAPLCKNPDLLLLCSLTWRQIMAQKTKYLTASVPPLALVSLIAISHMHIFQKEWMMTLLARINNMRRWASVQGNILTEVTQTHNKIHWPDFNW